MKKVVQFFPKLSVNKCDGISFDISLDKKMEILNQTLEIGCDSYNFEMSVVVPVDKFLICPSSGHTSGNYVLMEDGSVCVLMEDGTPP